MPYPAASPYGPYGLFTDPMYSSGKRVGQILNGQYQAFESPTYWQQQAQQSNSAYDALAATGEALANRAQETRREWELLSPISSMALIFRLQVAALTSHDDAKVVTEHPGSTEVLPIPEKIASQPTGFNEQATNVPSQLGGYELVDQLPAHEGIAPEYLPTAGYSTPDQSDQMGPLVYMNENQGDSPSIFKNKFQEDSIGTPTIISDTKLHYGAGRYNYVVTEDGKLVIGRRDQNIVGGGHIDLANGQPVLAAGEVKIVRGEIKSIDNASGHYEPYGAKAQAAAEAAFTQQGFDVTGKYVEKTWVPDSSLPGGGSWRAIDE